MSPEVLVIGAGPAGIASAYYLQQAGIPYQVVDRAEQIASTWNSLYPSLKLNTSRFFSHLPEKRFPLSYGLFPTGKQYHHYLCEYVQEQQLNIQLGVTVHSITPENNGWRVIANDRDAWYPAVISATGRFGKPYTPHIAGMETFNGRLYHAHQYLNPHDFDNRRVMVLGNGPSGVDIATELGRIRRDPNRPIFLGQRTGVVLRPRYPYGLPKHVWVMIGEKLPKKWGDKLIDTVNGAKFKNLDRYGIKTPVTEEESSAAGGTRGYELIDVVKKGWVKPTDAPIRFTPDAVELQDGTLLELDDVILCTGYHAVMFNYFNEPVEVDNQGWAMRVDGNFERQDTGKRQIKGYEGLYLVGVFYTGKGAMYNFNVEAEQAVREIQEHLGRFHAG
jgi:hypothetical protein